MVGAAAFYQYQLLLGALRGIRGIERAGHLIREAKTYRQFPQAVYNVRVC